MFTETNSLSTLLHVADAVSFFLFDIREHCFHFSYALQPFACLLFAVICLFLIWFDLALSLFDVLVFVTVVLQKCFGFD